MTLRQQIAIVRARLREAISKRHDAKPGGDRREKLARLVRALREKLEDLLARLARRDRLNLSPGSPHWGGSGDVMKQVVEPFMVARGLPIGSGKRTPAHNAAIGGSPTSDHLTTKTTTDARDFRTCSGEDDARALAKKLGVAWAPNSYGSGYFTYKGTRFRAQILWGAAIAHGDHVHVGISRA